MSGRQHRIAEIQPSPLSAGGAGQEAFRDPPIVPNPVYTVSSYAYIRMRKFNLQIGRSKRITAKANDKIEQL